MPAWSNYRFALREPVMKSQARVLSNRTSLRTSHHHFLPALHTLLFRFKPSLSFSSLPSNLYIGGKKLTGASPYANRDFRDTTEQTHSCHQSFNNYASMWCLFMIYLPSPFLFQVNISKMGEHLRHIHFFAGYKYRQSLLSLLPWLNTARACALRKHWGQPIYPGPPKIACCCHWF